MSLDLGETASQIGQALGHFVAKGEDERKSLEQAIAQVRELHPDILERRRKDGRHTWLAAGLDGRISGSYSFPNLPDEYAVVATDGSHIDIDRNLPASTCLINIGHVLLQYGANSRAKLWSTPTLYAGDESLMLRNPESGFDETRLSGQILGMKRAVMEVQALVGLVESVPESVPVVALLDGSLVLFALAGRNVPSFVKTELLQNGLIPVLNQLYEMSKKRTLAVASYISSPGSREIINTLRLNACPYPVVDCDYYCKSVKAGSRPCDSVGIPIDRSLFKSLLRTGNRSDLYRSLSSIVTDHYGEMNQIRFFYLNSDEEIARVEMPTWSSNSDDLLGFCHAVLLSQINKGQGYPVALSEAHEQAVISSQDRFNFETILRESLASSGLDSRTSEKARSKRIPLA